MTTAPPFDAPATETTAEAVVAPVVRRRLLLGAAYLAVVGVLGFLYGVLPGGRRSLPLSTVSLIEGWVECLRDGLQPCTYVGYPLGVNLSLSRSVVMGAYLLNSLGMSVPAALNLLALACIAVGVAALWLLVLRLTSSHPPAVLAVAVYFVSPLVINHAGLVTLFTGFAFLPVPVALTYFAVTATRPLAAIALSVATFATALVLIYADPYPYVIAAVCGACLGVAAAVRGIRLRSWAAVGLAAGVLAAIALPAFVYRALQGDTGLEVEMPPEFYRAMGADVATMFLPTQDVLIGDLIGGPFDRWNPHEFYGNHTHLRAVFLGGVLLVTALAGLVILFRQRQRRWFAVGLATAAAICLVVGLGPSLKIADRADRPTFVDPTQELDDYLMPAELAQFTFPWSGIYEVQPFASMRATYRWHAGVRLAAGVFAGVAIAAAGRRRRLLAVGLAGLLVVESVPHLLLQHRQVASDQYEQIQEFNDDVSTAFGGHLDAGERVLFLPATNDYLIPVIAARYDVFAYNIAFDKEIERIRPQQPAAIVEAEVAHGEGALTSAQVCSLLGEDLVDAVVFTEFDPRWNSYRWPPSDRARLFLRRRYQNVGVEDDPAFTVDDRDLAIIVRATPARSGGRCAPDGS
jgi:hypothetical protein